MKSPGQYDLTFKKGIKIYVAMIIVSLIGFSGLLLVGVTYQNKVENQLIEEINDYHLISERTYLGIREAVNIAIQKYNHFYQNQQPQKTLTSPIITINEDGINMRDHFNGLLFKLKQNMRSLHSLQDRYEEEKFIFLMNRMEQQRLILGAKFESYIDKKNQFKDVIGLLKIILVTAHQLETLHNSSYSKESSILQELKSENLLIRNIFLITGIIINVLIVIILFKRINIVIAGRQKAERNLRRSEDRYRSIYTKTHAMLHSIDNNGEIIAVSDYWLQKLGYNRSEVIGKKSVDFLTKESKRYAVNVELPKSKERGYANDISFQFVKKNGEIMDILLSAVTEYDLNGNFKQSMAVLNDVTERKRAEEELERSLETLKSVMDTTFDSIFVVDNEQKPVYYNDKFLEMVELSKDPMTIADFKKWIKSVYHLLKDPDIYKKRVKYFIENPEAEGYDVLEFKNGKVYERHTTPHIADGKVVGRIWSFNDITDAKREESKRVEVEKKLQTAERMESLGLLAGGVAHDLNNVLGMIQAYPDLILEDLPEDTPVKNDLLDMKQAATDATQIISDLLAMARRGKYKMEPLNLNEIVSSYLISPSFKTLKNKNKKIKLELDLAEQIKEIEGSRIHLYKVIMNLVQNAVEAIPRSGKVSIRSYSDQLKAQPSLFEELKDGEYVLLKIRDSGSGVSEEDISHIFEPFYSKKKMGKSGSGLGLSVVWSVVKDHGGYINIETSENEGTEFTLYFPVTEKKKKSPVKKLKTIGGKESILVVDDEARQRKIAVKVLTSLGYDVTTAANGEETLNFLRSNDLDLIILDMIMENEDEGLEIFKKIIELKPTQKAIIVSGFSESEYVKEAKKLGVGDFIMKPYTKNDLGNAVREELDR